MEAPVWGTILVVEDDADDAYLINRAFEAAGELLEIVNVARVDAAISFLEQDPFVLRPPVLILQDIKMPVKSGFEFLVWIRQMPILRSIPVIVLTDSIAPIDINRAYELGANSYVVKARMPEELIKMVKDLDTYWLRENVPPNI